MFTRNFTIVDVETTGGSPNFSRIIEIGILRIEHGEVVEKFKSFVNPGIPIPEFIAGYTGITDRMVKNAPSFTEIAEEILCLFESSVLVAHNSNFDYGFLRSEFMRAGFVFNADTLCTLRLSRALFPEHKHHNLSAIIKRYDFTCKNRHRAFDDANVLWQFLNFIMSCFSKERINTILERVLRKIPSKKQHKMPEKMSLEPIYVPEEDF